MSSGAGRRPNASRYHGVVTSRGQQRRNTGEYPRTRAVVFSLARLWFGAAANFREHLRMNADPSCKRAVVSSILTGGSMLYAAPSVIQPLAGPL
jgi:hypothetical protein